MAVTESEKGWCFWRKREGGKRESESERGCGVGRVRFCKVEGLFWEEGVVLVLEEGCPVWS